MTTKELIRAEIERREKILTNVYEEQLERKDEEMMNYYHGKVVALEELLTFLDTLPEEPVSDDLEEAAMNYIAPIENEDGLKVINFSGRDIKDAFIAGAKWGAEHLKK